VVGSSDSEHDKTQTLHLHQRRDEKDLVLWEFSSDSEHDDKNTAAVGGLDRN
jgi:hypothetical protein